MQHFNTILDIAQQRKGGSEKLSSLLPDPLSDSKLKILGEDRFLAMMTKCINQAGFSWKVIENKWPQFEEAFFGFKPDTLLMLSDEQWEAYTQDKRVVRNWQKIKTVKENALMIMDERQRQTGGIATLIADWPTTDQIGLMAHLKKHGSRLGGNTAQWFLRSVGKDGFVLTKDVIGTLRTAGLEIKPQPTSQKEMKLIQGAFNQWQDETGLCMTHLSKIAAYAFGDNRVGIV